ncbi:MAG: hypothetical protein VB142_06605 [Burkholderia sp.]
MMDTTLASIFAGAYDGHAESLTKVADMGSDDIGKTPCPETGQAR